MSGYLLRMAASVLKPGGAIHPVLGSVYASSPIEMGGEEAAEQSSGRALERQVPALSPRHEVVPLPLQPEPAATTRLDHGEPQDAMRVDAPPLVDVPRLDDASDERTVEPARVSFQPLVKAAQKVEEPEEILAVTPKKAILVASEVERMAPIAQPGAWQIPAQPKPGQEVLGTPPGEMPRQETVVVHEVASKEHYRPLVPQLANQAIQRPAQTFPAVARKAGKRELPIREAKAERQSDEIQIHIGRIEVVAAPPAPVRVESKPESKSPSLGDYLKLRHGRS